MSDTDTFALKGMKRHEACDEKCLNPMCDA